MGFITKHLKKHPDYVVCMVLPYPTADTQIGSSLRHATVMHDTKGSKETTQSFHEEFTALARGRHLFRQRPGRHQAIPHEYIFTPEISKLSTRAIDKIKSAAKQPEGAKTITSLHFRGYEQTMSKQVSHSSFLTETHKHAGQNSNTTTKSRIEEVFSKIDQQNTALSRIGKREKRRQGCCCNS